MEVIIDSVKYETIQLENGKWTLPKEIKKCLKSRCGALNIDGNRVSIVASDIKDVGRIINRNVREIEDGWGMQDNKADVVSVLSENGRYPSQTFCDSNTAEVLDKQSGISKGRSSGYNFELSNNQDNVVKINNNFKSGVHFDDTGGCSKILHKCNYEQGDYDIYNYNPKVSKSERNAGCDEFEDKIKHWHDMENANKNQDNPKNYLGGKITHQIVKNNHPTLKPIALNEKILKLFKTPNDDKIVYPFAGSGSEVIGGLKAGFTNWVGCEINPEYVEIAKARIDYWTKQNEQLQLGVDIE